MCWIESVGTWIGFIISLMSQLILLSFQNTPEQEQKSRRTRLRAFLRKQYPMQRHWNVDENSFMYRHPPNPLKMWKTFRSIVLNEKLDPKLDPKLDLEFDPKIDPKLDLEFDPKLDPKLDLEFDPKLDPKLDPEWEENEVECNLLLEDELKEKKEDAVPMGLVDSLPTSLFIQCLDEQWRDAKERFDGNVIPTEIPDELASVDVHSLLLVILRCEILFSRSGSYYLHLSSPSLSRFHGFFETRNFHQHARAPITMSGHCGSHSTKICSLHLASSILISSKHAELFELWCSTHPDFCLGWFFLLPIQFFQWNPLHVDSKSIVLTYVLRERPSAFAPRIFSCDSWRLNIRSVSASKNSTSPFIFDKWFQLALFDFLNLRDSCRLSLTNRQLFSSFHRSAFQLSLQKFLQFNTSTYYPELSLFSPFGEPWYFAQLLYKSFYLGKFVGSPLIGCSLGRAFSIFEIELCREGKIYLDSFTEWMKTGRHPASSSSVLSSSSSSSSVLSSSSSSSSSSVLSSPSSFSSPLIVSSSSSSSPSQVSWWTYSFDRDTKTFQKMTTFDLFQTYKYEQWALLFPKRLRPFPWRHVEYYLHLFHQEKYLEGEEEENTEKREKEEEKEEAALEKEEKKKEKRNRKRKV